MTNREKIIQKALEFLKQEPPGIRYSTLVKMISAALPEIPQNTIHGTIWNVETQIPDQIYKPGRGLYRHVMFRETAEVSTTVPPVVAPPKIKEEDFYAPFAEYLVKELEECSKAIVIGGNKFKDKWVPQM
ncbi:MAG: hypothetical protein MN733_42410 [Nitrososphaera sp.]|nr:hypothetical protein [Nitrososphaera sp.]